MVVINSDFDDLVPEKIRDKYVQTEYMDGSEDTANVCVTFIKRGTKSYVLGALCTDVLEKGKNWPMWLSFYFPDDFISTLVSYLEEWKCEWELEKQNKEMGDLITKSYQVVLTVPNETLIIEEIT